MSNKSLDYGLIGLGAAIAVTGLFFYTRKKPNSIVNSFDALMLETYDPNEPIKATWFNDNGKSSSSSRSSSDNKGILNSNSSSSSPLNIRNSLGYNMSLKKNGTSLKNGGTSLKGGRHHKKTRRHRKK